MSDIVETMVDKHIENLARKLIEEERRLQQYAEDIKGKYPEAQSHFDALQEGFEHLAEMREELKSELIKADDYDVHSVDGHQFSLTKVVKMKVKDIDEVPADFKQTMEVADEKRAAKYYKLYGEAPKGFQDASYNKLNMKEVS